MFSLDDIKVYAASLGGLGHHWVLNLEPILSLCLTGASLVYVVIKIVERLDRQKGGNDEKTNRS